MENKLKVFIGYVPVVHRGVIELFEKSEFNLIYILSESMIETLAKEGLGYLERDIRRVNSENVVSMLNALVKDGLFKSVAKVGIVDELTIKSLIMDDEVEFCTTADEIGYKINELYFAPNDEEIYFNSAFLRWDKLISTQELAVSADRVVSDSAIDREFIKDALSESEKSSDWWRHVGCVIVTKNNKKVFGYNRHLPHEHIPYIEGDIRSNFNPGERNDLGTAIHAETSAVSIAARDGIAIDGATMYASTFPCQNCARVIVNAGIKKVLYKSGYSVQDAERIFKDAGVEIVLVK